MGEDLKDRQAVWLRAWRERGDQAARLRLIDSVQGLVKQAARKQAGSGLSIDELQAEALTAVVEAIEVCDIDRANGFAGCVYVLIRKRLLELCRSSSTAAVGSRSRPERSLRYNLVRLVSKWERQGYDPAYALRLAAAELGVPHEHAAASMAVRSAERLGFGRADDDGGSGMEIAADADPVEDRLDVSRVAHVLEDCMSGLDEREIRVVRSVFVEGGSSLDVLAEELGVTRRRVSQIRDEAVDHIRFELRRRGLGLEDLIAS